MLMKLKQIGEKTYYIENDTNIGVYMTGDNHVCLIDTGSRGTGEIIDEIIASKGWKIDYIINTHSHIDHLGGNKYLMEKYGIPAYCTDIDMAFANFPDLEASYMNGGKPAAKLRHIFAHPGKIGFRSIEDVEEAALNGLQWMSLPGHTFGMIGVRTSDDVWFLGDAYLSKAYMQKRTFAYLCDIEEYLATLEMLKGLEGKFFVPAHGVVEEDISEILSLNVENQRRLLAAVEDACTEASSFDDILSCMYEVTMLKNNAANHALLSSTVKCYLTYLQDIGRIECEFTDNKMVWKKAVKS